MKSRSAARVEMDDMAGLEEMAIGIATVLQMSTTPEPLPMELRHQTLENGAHLVRTVIDECVDAAIPLNKVQIDRELFEHMGRHPEIAGVLIEPSGATAELRFFRSAE
jgi:hypothetical protein